MTACGAWEILLGRRMQPYAARRRFARRLCPQRTMKGKEMTPLLPTLNT